MLFDLKVIATFEIEIHILASFSISISEEAMTLCCPCSGISWIGLDENALILWNIIEVYVNIMTCLLDWSQFSFGFTH